MQFGKTGKFAGKLICASFATLTLALSCSGKGKVDLSKAQKLAAEPVETNSNSNSENGPQLHALFSKMPGSTIGFEALATIDPTGTSIADDYDGDGIKNINETTTNPWVADYPKVETNISTPVTLKIAIQKTSTNTTEEIVSDITSDDFESVTNRGNDSAHRNEVQLRTAQFRDSLSRFDATADSKFETHSEQYEAGLDLGIFSLGGSGGKESSSSSSFSQASGFSETKTSWREIPFRNDLDRSAWSVKSSSAARSARNYRNEKKQKNVTGTIVPPNAGYVRAALYIQNMTANIPVRISNILASLVFVSQKGEVIPVQSFRLRNDDYSLFSVDVYGGSQFGPYVVELNNLNTAEIEKALLLGHNPKIHIVDYEMTHVPDSNYRSKLLNYSGDNLKIVEENAKGRTAFLKILSPGARENYRVAAFSVPGQGANPCSLSAAAGAATPGVTFREALSRIGCSGVNIQTENYLMDFSDALPNMRPAKLVIPLVKSVSGVANRIPCANETQPTSGLQVCRIKPFSQWTEAERAQFGVWTIFSAGKYFSFTEFQKNSDGSIATYEGTSYAPDGTGGTPLTKGIDSLIWAGDQYDLTYLSVEDFMQSMRTYGTNMLETGVMAAVNTKWDEREFVNTNRFDPEVHSVFLGQAGMGDKIELTFKLKDTTFLNPSFGENFGNAKTLEFDKFTYNKKIEANRFNVDEAVDFEISMGIGGAISDWEHILHPSGSSAQPNPNGIKILKKSIEFADQVFRIQIQLPNSHPLVGAGGLVGLYLRPVLRNAFRNSIWPEDYRKVKKIKAEISADAPLGSSQLVISTLTGDLHEIVPATDKLKIVNGNSEAEYGLLTDFVKIPLVDRYLVTLSAPTTESYLKGQQVYISGKLLKPEISLVSDYATETDSFSASWNNDFGNSSPTRLLQTNSTFDCATKMVATKCYGFKLNEANSYMIDNWLGGQSYLNSWSSTLNFETFTNSAFPSLAEATNGSSLRFYTNPENSDGTEISGGDLHNGTAHYWKSIELSNGLILQFYSQDLQNVNGSQMLSAALINPATNKFVYRDKPLYDINQSSPTGFPMQFLRVEVKDDLAVVLYGVEPDGEFSPSQSLFCRILRVSDGTWVTHNMDPNGATSDRILLGEVSGAHHFVHSGGNPADTSLDGGEAQYNGKSQFKQYGNGLDGRGTATDAYADLAVWGDQVYVAWIGDRGRMAWKRQIDLANLSVTAAQQINTQSHVNYDDLRGMIVHASPNGILYMWNNFVALDSLNYTQYPGLTRYRRIYQYQFVVYGLDGIPKTTEQYVRPPFNALYVVNGVPTYLLNASIESHARIVNAGNKAILMYHRNLRNVLAVQNPNSPDYVGFATIDMTSGLAISANNWLNIGLYGFVGPFNIDGSIVGFTQSGAVKYDPLTDATQIINPNIFANFPASLPMNSLAFSSMYFGFEYGGQINLLFQASGLYARSWDPTTEKFSSTRRISNQIAHSFGIDFLSGFYSAGSGFYSASNFAGNNRLGIMAGNVTDTLLGGGLVFSHGFRSFENRNFRAVPKYSLNNFFISPFIERNYEVGAALVLE